MGGDTSTGRGGGRGQAVSKEALDSGRRYIDREGRQDRRGSSG